MKLVIKHHRPARRLFAWVASALGVAVLVGIAMDFGQWRYVLSANRANDLRSENRELRARNEDLLARLQRLQQAADIELDTRREMQQEIADLHREIADLNQENEFYRGIIASVDDEAGPRVEGLRIAPFDSEGRYRYRVVLTNVNEDDRIVEGNLRVSISGEQNGARRSLQLKDIAESGAEDLAFKFKHFRRMEGIIRLPAGFEAGQVTVALMEKGGSRALFDATYNWSDLTN